MSTAKDTKGRDRETLRREVEGLRSVYTIYPKLKKIRQAVIDLKNRDNSKSQGNVYLLMGEPGAGKTKLIEDLERSFPRQESAIQHENGDFADNAELVVASIPDTTSKGVAASIYAAIALSEAGDVLGKRVNRTEIEKNCIRLAKETRLKLLILEEAHQSIDDETEKVAKEVAVTVKTMVNAKLFSILLVGTEAALRLVTAKSELARRTPKVLRMDAFANTGEDWQVWLDILSDYEDKLEKVFGRRSGLEEPALAEALRVGGFGYVGNMALLVEEAAQLAVDEMLAGGAREPGITWDNLEESYGLWALGIGSPNPFRAECRPPSAAPKRVRSRAEESNGKDGNDPKPLSSPRQDKPDDPMSGVRGVTRSTRRDTTFRR